MINPKPLLVIGEEGEKLGRERRKGGWGGQ